MIQYKKRIKYLYTLIEDYEYLADIIVKEPGDIGLLSITKDGLLKIKSKYAWDGPSGPTIDTKNFMRGSLVHDALYQLMREKKINQNQRLRADEILREICIDAGMSKLRAWWVFKGVRIGGAKSAKLDVLTAP
ncbi:DUF1353 domain-containing protein [candidate division KSB1 bacterium]|nr:DUF1353 domain-containing protein [candidate division KSB1 bacterium]